MSSGHTKTTKKKTGNRRTYEELRAAGWSDRSARKILERDPDGTIADANRMRMIEEARPPGAGLNDTTFRAGRTAKRNKWRDTDKDTLDDYLAIAKRAGVDTGCKDYYSALAEEPGDPNAWCSDMSEVRDKCKAKGWECKIEGGVLQVGTKGRVGVAHRRSKQKKKAEKKNGS